MLEPRPQKVHLPFVFILKHGRPPRPQGLPELIRRISMLTATTRGGSPYVTGGTST